MTHVKHAKVAKHAKLNRFSHCMVLTEFRMKNAVTDNTPNKLPTKPNYSLLRVLLIGLFFPNQRNLYFSDYTFPAQSVREF